MSVTSGNRNAVVHHSYFATSLFRPGHNDANFSYNRPPHTMAMTGLRTTAMITLGLLVYKRKSSLKVGLFELRLIS
jgi:hypothetical protein